MQVRLRVHLLDLVRLCLLESHGLWLVILDKAILRLSYEISEQILLLLALRAHVCGCNNSRVTGLLVIDLRLVVAHFVFTAYGVLGETELLSALLFCDSPMVGHILITVLRLERGVV